jgi:hypothetical protein
MSGDKPLTSSAVYGGGRLVAKYTDDHGTLHDLDMLELGSTKTSAKDVAKIALDLSSHAKALLGRLSEQQLLSDRDKALGDLSYVIAAIKSIASKA